ncbi:MAG TPA: hypothetical protein VIB82_02370 [Caulobacteraceae bacterium]
MPTAWRGAWAALLLAAATLAGWLAAVGGAASLFSAPVWLGIAMAAMLVARGALWRLVLAREGRGPGGLQLGAVEARLVAVWALSGVFLAVLALLLFVALLCFAYAAASAGPGFDPARVMTWAPAVDGRGRILLGAVAALGAVGMIFAAARVSLAEAASIGGGRVQVLSTWILTRRLVWPILAGNGAIALLPAVAVLLAPAGVGWRLVAAGVVAGVWLPMSIGLMAYVFDNRAAQKADV